MPRIMGIDYGLKRTGIAVTDTLQIAVHPYKTVPTSEFLEEITNYLSREDVEKIVFGKPTHADGTNTYLVPHIEKAIQQISQINSNLKFDFQDETSTSVEAQRILIDMGVKKKKRRDKTKLDLISAVLILQKYLKHI